LALSFGFFINHNQESPSMMIKRPDINMTRIKDRQPRRASEETLMSKLGVLFLESLVVTVLCA
jgi:hypothetical protein